MYDYSNEPHGIFFWIDNKSFYASCEAIQRGYNPLKVPLVVISEAENTNGGLVLATSPEAKKLYGLKANVSRQRDLPHDPNLVVVPPRMNLYIKRNGQINQIFRTFAADDDVFPYSIDESIIDMTHSYHLFGDNPRKVARKIQETVRKKLGLYTTVGIGDNPVQAKIALDIYAKHNHDLIGEIHYETIPDKIWKIPEITKVWSIGKRTARRLKKLHINNMYELAHTNPYLLREKMGVIGEQLFAVAWGIDRSNIRNKPVAKEKSIGNSQVLPRDYGNKRNLETVIKEIGEQVAARLRHHKKLAGCLSLGLGFSYVSIEEDGRSGIHHSMKIEPTDNNLEITSQLLFLFHKYWEGQAIRHISVYTSHLSDNNGQQLNLFYDTKQQIHNEDLNNVVDKIHQKYGFGKLVYGNSKLNGATAINRKNLVGGHNGGNSYE